MTEPSAPQPPASGEQSFLSHLMELRDRLLRSVVVLLVIFLACFPFSSEIYSFLAAPVTQYLPEGQRMVAIDPISPFLTPLKTSLVAAFFLAIPYLLYQFWAFVAPGLYQHEKRLALPLLISSIVLFYLGMAFAYVVVFPLVFGYIATIVPEGVAHTPDIRTYLDFSLKLFFAFGVAFEVPIATIILIATGMTTRESLANKRPYIIVGAFVIGMLLTPPDIISQTLLALPMWALFEMGLIMSSVLLKKRDEASIAPGGEGGEVVATGPAATPPATAPSAPDSGVPPATPPAGGTGGAAEATDEDGEPWYEEHNPHYEDDEFVELSDAEMDAELDRAIAEEEKLGVDEAASEDSHADADETVAGEDRGDDDEDPPTSKA